MRPISLICVVLSYVAYTYGGSCTLRRSGEDDGPAFLSAVKACSHVTIPKDTILNISSPLNMTNVKNKHIDLRGTIKFNPDIDFWSTNSFSFPFQNETTFWIFGGTNLLVNGGGAIDGSGQVWYDAFATNASLVRPILLTLFQAENVLVEDIHMMNSPQWFNFVNEGKHVVFQSINISSVSTNANRNKNTDGWNTYRSNDVTIKNSVINNGDDCVAFKPNSTNIFVTELNCNGSHGISVGSLGQFPGVFDVVENVTASHVRLSNVENGARIKAWAGPNVGSGIVRNITFKHFSETNSDNPLIIDQCYMTDPTVCAEFPSNTLIQDVTFTDISGTPSGLEGSVVASLKCSPDARCENIVVNNLKLMAPANEGPATYVCQNVNVTGNAAHFFNNCTTT
ncbi:glycoside hydrolase family 28 protein [Rickenella mellea]|uniref:galacturonan 1,4-alpha-galacturonidase n=1 Tax=Rickenella mellea TaxID=50990 RepID=A0A4Y7PU09_9AGAM|nr:glycoside hydrolase family 28 protein [Rickenella mellea]